MRTPLLYAVLSLLLLAPASAGDDALNPHRMVAADGTPDVEKCAFCHTDTLDLARPKKEICTLCHSETVHAGSIEHLRAPAREVARLLASAAEGAPEPSLTEEGTIYCGTCHLFHDPSVSADQPLPHSWTPPRSGVAEAVRSSLETQALAVARRHREEGPALRFASEGTTALTMPVADGSLCRRCHEGYAR